MTTPPLTPSQKERGKISHQSKKKPPLSSGRGTGGEAKKERFISLFIFAFAFLLYANTLNHGYVLDDDVVYLKNRHVQAGINGIKDILTHSFTYGFTGNNDKYQSYRPVTLIFYAIEKDFFGNNPHTGHFINVFLFALSCLLLYKLINKLFLSHGSILNTQYSILIVLLFAAHPIHTEAVANIKGRDDILNFIFIVSALLFVLKFADEELKKYLWLSALFFFLSLLCKEIAVTFLAIIPLTIFFFRNVSVKKITLYSIPFVAVFGIYIGIRNSILDPAASTKDT